MPAESGAGFVGRTTHDPETNEQTWGPNAAPQFYVEEEHAGAPATLSLWDDLESVFAFLYYGLHGEALSKRKEWFVNPEWPTFACWWVADKGPTPFAFTFKSAFGPDGGELTIDRERIKQLAEHAWERTG